MNRIITISREFGSGGRTVGKETAAKLGIPCYDQQLIEKVSAKSGLSGEYIQDRGEYSQSSNWLSQALSGRDFYGHSHLDDLWNIQRDTILELAEEGPCVIVGRCADYILRDRADCLTVFIHAAMEKRIERIVTLYKESDERPEKRLRDKDKRRRSYYQLYTDTEWGVAKNYHIALDSGVLGIDTCVKILTELF